MVEINQLEVGNIIQNIQSGNSYEVIISDGDRVFAVREIQITNPDEWVLVGVNPYQKSTSLSLYLSTLTELPHLFRIVQENQGFFGDPSAGTSCVKLAVDKLEELIEASKNEPNK